MGFNKKFFQTGGIVASQPAAAAFDALQNFEVVTYTGNGGTQKITGYIRKGAAFNGSSSNIDIGGNIVNGLTELSVSLWVFWDGTNSVNDNYFIALGKSNSGKIFSADITNNSGIIGFYDGANVFNSNSAVPQNTWTHIVITANATVAKIYLNGNLDSTHTISSLNFDSSGNVGFIGSWISGTDYEFDGKIDQVRIFNKALSSGEVTTLYGETYASSTKSTTDIFGDGSGIALYELNEDANDSSGISLASTHYFFVSDAGNLSSSADLHSVSSEFVQSKPSGFSDWGGTFDPNNTSEIGGLTLTNGNKTFTKNSSYYNAVWSTNGYNSGKYYFELKFLGTELIFGLTTLTTATQPLTTSFNDESVYYNSYSTLSRAYSSTNTSQGVVLSTNDILGFAVDFDNQEIKYYRNGTLIDTVTMESTNYNGTPTNINFLGMAFQPDFVWIKDRDYNQNNHHLFDIIRGTNVRLMTNLTNAENTEIDCFNSFDSNGFSLGANQGVNFNGNDFVAWCWKAGGAAVSNTNGTITSQVSANQAAGFSIVKFTSPSSGVATIGTGLNTQAELIISKVTNTAADWPVFVDGFDTTDYILLNTTGAKVNHSSDLWNLSNWSNTTFGCHRDMYGTSNTVIAYCFHSVDGYQKVGSYTGNGGSSVNSITTGFEPRFLMFKRTDTSGYNWVIYDNVRDTANPINFYLNPNTSDAESGPDSSAAVNFVSNGFEIPTTSSWAGVNGSGGTFIYLAIA